MVHKHIPLARKVSIVDKILVPGHAYYSSCFFLTSSSSMKLEQMLLYFLQGTRREEGSPLSCLGHLYPLERTS
jgi:hypothetical protein